MKNHFSKDEWQLIADGPEWVFAALSAADGNVALTVKMKESSTFKKFVKDYRSRSGVVNAVIEDKIKPEKAIKHATLSDAEQALEEINDLLSGKLEQKEADNYRKFLIETADSVANAAGEGLLGVGNKLSKKEAKALDKVKNALKSIPSKKKTTTSKKSSNILDMIRKKAEAAKTAKIPVKKTKTATVPKTKVAKKPERKIVKPAKKRTTEGVVPKREKVVPAKAPKKEYLATHEVAAGETLSHISLKYYGSAVKAKYMLIYEENKAVIGDNPNIIKPGQKLNIPKI